MIFFIKNPNLTKQNLAGGRGRDESMASVSDFFLKESKSEKMFFFFFFFFFF